jgi:hypothetical protein
MEILSNDCKFNYLTHLIFPARTKIKELIYWPTELAAAIIFVIYLFQMQLTEITLYRGLDETVTTSMIKKPSDGSWGSGTAVDGVMLGLAYENKNNAFSISNLDTDLLNREYAWICLCYMIKHALYIIDFYLLYKRNRVAYWDFLTPLNNLWLWVMWGIYGWTQAGLAIHGGMYLRFRKDVIFASDLSSDASYKAAKDAYAKTEEAYDKVKTWQWLWLVCLAVLIINSLLWALGLYMKRSSAYHGQALSTIAIPAQLLVLHLFLKGSWIRSNWANLFINTTSAPKAYYTRDGDYFEARWIFFILYLAAWGGLILSFVCLHKARVLILGKQKDVLKGLKYLFYCIFWGSAFIWMLFLDNTLYHYFINVKTGLIITQLICMGAAVFIFVLSFLEKHKEGDKFYERHDNWWKWWYSTDALCGNMADASQMVVQGRTTGQGNATQYPAQYQGAQDPAAQHLMAGQAGANNNHAAAPGQPGQAGSVTHAGQQPGQVHTNPVLQGGAEYGKPYVR